MRFIRLVCIFCFLLTTLSSCAQSKYGIKKIHAFSKEQMPGNIRMAKEGDAAFNGPDTVHIIYIETKGTTATWESGWWNNRIYTVSANPVSERTIVVGKELSTGKTVTISADAGNKLWVLYLNTTDTKTKAPVSKKKGEILLRGKYGTKVITQLIKSVKMLESIPSV